jgi:hypothetical protein
MAQQLTDYTLTKFVFIDVGRALDINSIETKKRVKEKEENQRNSLVTLTIGSRLVNGDNYSNINTLRLLL